MSTLNLILDTNDTDVFVQTNSGIETANNIALLFKTLSGGTRPKSATLTAQVTPLKASGTVTLSSSSGVITTTINGVAVATGSLAGTDTENAAAVATAINASANALVSGIVTASSALGVVTVTAVVRGKVGNAITLAASGTGATASGARLTAGSDGTSTAFTF